MPMKSLKDVTNKKSLKYAQGMYWSNLALVALALGTIMPRTLNKMLKKNVEKEVNQANTPKKEFFQKLLSTDSYVDINEALTVMRQ